MQCKTIILLLKLCSGGWRSDVCMAIHGKAELALTCHTAYSAGVEAHFQIAFTA